MKRIIIINLLAVSLPAALCAGKATSAATAIGGPGGPSMQQGMPSVGGRPMQRAVSAQEELAMQPKIQVTPSAPTVRPSAPTRPTPTVTRRSEGEVIPPAKKTVTTRLIPPVVAPGQPREQHEERFGASEVTHPYFGHEVTPPARKTVTTRLIPPVVMPPQPIIYYNEGPTPPGENVPSAEEKRKEEEEARRRHAVFPAGPRVTPPSFAERTEIKGGVAVKPGATEFTETRRGVITKPRTYTEAEEIAQQREALGGKKQVITKPGLTTITEVGREITRANVPTTQTKTTISQAAKEATQKSVTERAQKVAEHAATLNTPGGAKPKQATATWAKKSSWEQSGGWTGVKVAKAKDFINRQGGITISGGVVLNPTLNVPWAHQRGAWAPWTKRWTNWWRYWAADVFNPDWFTWEYPQWWTNLPSWYEELGLTSTILISLAQERRYDDLFARFNAAIDYLQEQLYQLQTERDELVDENRTEEVNQVEVEIDQLQDEINSLNQDVAWVAVRASEGKKTCHYELVCD